jgi:hypothetical protein
MKLRAEFLPLEVHRREHELRRNLHTDLLQPSALPRLGCRVVNLIHGQPCRQFASPIGE